MKPILGMVLGAALITAGAWLAQPPTAPARADENAGSGVPEPKSSVGPVARPAANLEPTARPLGKGWRIRIARIGIDLPIEDGDPARDIAQQMTPDGAAYRLAGSALPGTAGNTYLYGHARWAQFIGLWYAHLDDLILISGPGTTLCYHVTEIHPRVATDDLTFLLPSAAEKLTLQTSSGPDRTDPRFIVVAVPAR
jgi:sortase (surface protein transpeptidase)